MNFINDIKTTILNSSIKTNLLKLYITIILVMSSMLVTLLLYSIDLNSTYNRIISNFKNYNNVYYKIGSIDKDIYLNITEQKPFDYENYAKIIKDIDDSLAAIRTSPDESDIYISVEVLKRTVNTVDKYIIDTGLLIKNNSAYNLRENKLNLIIEAKTIVKDKIQQLMALDLTHSQKRIDAIKNRYNIALSIIIVLLILSVFISIAFLLLVIKGIINKISIVSENANKLANGDLSIEQITFNDSDEFQILARSFNQMKDNINNYISQISSNEMKISTILNEMTDCLITTNSKGKIESCNYAVEKIFDYKPNEILGRNINELVELIDVSLYQSHEFDNQKLIKDAKAIDDKYQLNGIKKDGTVFPVEFSYKEIELEGNKALTFVLQDITQHKEIERMKNEFISTVSHELRTPLTSIRGALGLVLSGAIGELPEKSKELLNIANNNSVRLITLINDILDLEKIKAGKMEFVFQEYEVMPLVEETVQLNDQYAKQYNVKYDIIERVDNTFIKVDRDKFIQVLTNLLSNAAKFSFKDEIVKILVERKGKNISISVINKGSGIPEESRSKVFETFSQVDSSDSRKKGGTGLGLSIAKSIIQKMDGNIGFTSELNDDTSFYFELPEVVKSSDNKTVSICESSVNKITEGKNIQDVNKMEILHVENDKDISSIMSFTLKDIASVTSVGSLSEAKDILSKSTFDVIILDYVFSEGTSDKLIPSIKSSSNKDAKLVIFSAYEESKILSRYVDAVLLKTNISNEQFRKCIEDLMSEKLNVN